MSYRKRAGIGSLLAIAFAAHIVAASLLYSRLVRDLFSLIEDAPRLPIPTKNKATVRISDRMINWRALVRR